MIRVNDFEQLKAILWDFHRDFISRENAFAMYEQRWAFIEEPSLKKDEIRLINSLIKQYGKGFFFPHTQNKEIKKSI